MFQFHLETHLYLGHQVKKLPHISYVKSKSFLLCLEMVKYSFTSPHMYDSSSKCIDYVVNGSKFKCCKDILSKASCG